MARWLRMKHMPAFANIKTREFKVTGDYTLRLNAFGFHSLNTATNNYATYYSLLPGHFHPDHELPEDIRKEAICYYRDRCTPELYTQMARLEIWTLSDHKIKLQKPLPILINGCCIAQIDDAILPGRHLLTYESELIIPGNAYYFIRQGNNYTNQAFYPFAPGGFDVKEKWHCAGLSQEKYIPARKTTRLFIRPFYELPQFEILSSSSQDDCFVY